MNRVVESGGAVHSPKKEHCYKDVYVISRTGYLHRNAESVGKGQELGLGSILGFVFCFFFFIIIISVLWSCLLTPAHVSSLCLDICHLGVWSSGDESMGSNVRLY